MYAHMQWTCINSNKTEVTRSISVSVNVNLQLGYVTTQKVNYTAVYDYV